MQRQIIGRLSERLHTIVVKILLVVKIVHQLDTVDSC